jgi:hypothetical protein
MSDQLSPVPVAAAPAGDRGKTSGFFGSLKDALAAASRDETIGKEAQRAVLVKPVPQLAPPAPAAAADAGGHASATEPQTILTAKEAARESRRPSRTMEDRHMEYNDPPTTRVVRAKEKNADGPARTQLVRGKNQVKRGSFDCDPVVGWLVVVGGPGIGHYRPVFEGNNTVGRSEANRIPIDFGDEAISSEEQGYIRYDSSERSFLFVPNLAKTNVVSVNDKKPTGAVTLSAMDVITMGRTQLVFVPFCGSEFDWAALAEK